MSPTDRTDPTDTRRNADVRAATHVRRLADELGVSLALLDGRGSGVGGRITTHDVTAAAESTAGAQHRETWFPGMSTPTVSA